jgi:S-adenosylmethionine:tRNA ribosyltransferase-isomerase
VAAPTAGLHFTRDLLDDVRGRGVRLAEVTLHVGYGTFAPIEVDDLREHVMHAEWFEVGEGARAALREARASGARVWAVGTTAARVLETIAREPERVRGWTRLLLAPPDSVTGFSAMLTNFHLPRSTLLALVMAVGGVDAVRAAYADAVLKRYKFFSYGDCMLLI